VKITRRQLRRIIAEMVGNRGAVGAEHGSSSYVAKMLNGQAAGPGKGFTFGELAMDAITAGDFRGAANKVMDALWVDDPWPEDEQALEDMLAQAVTLDDVATIGGEWLDGFRKGLYTSRDADPDADLRQW